MSRILLSRGDTVRVTAQAKTAEGVFNYLPLPLVWEHNLGDTLHVVPEDNNTSALVTLLNYGGAEHAINSNVDVGFIKVRSTDEPYEVTYMVGFLPPRDMYLDLAVTDVADVAPAPPAPPAPIAEMINMMDETRGRISSEYGNVCLDVRPGPAGDVHEHHIFLYANCLAPINWEIVHSNLGNPADPAKIMVIENPAYPDQAIIMCIDAGEYAQWIDQPVNCYTVRAITGSGTYERGIKFVSQLP